MSFTITNKNSLESIKESRNQLRISSDSKLCRLKTCNSAFTLAAGHGTVQYGTVWYVFGVFTLAKKIYWVCIFKLARYPS